MPETDPPVARPELHLVSEDDVRDNGGAECAQLNPQVVALVRTKATRRMTIVEAFDLAAHVIFTYWMAQTGRNGRTIFDKKRKARLVLRLRENSGNVAELLHCVDGAIRDDWIMGRRGDSTTKFDGIETIFRDRAQVERFVEAAHVQDITTHPFMLEAVKRSWENASPRSR